ncbi:MAG: S8 family serine peptidase [Phycisphaerales bacterium JB050]
MFVRTSAMSFLLGACIFAAGTTVSIADAAGPGSAKASGTKVVRIDSAKLAQSGLNTISTEQSLDYGSFVWVEAGPEMLASLNAAGVPFHEVQQPYTVRLGELAFDPVVDGEPTHPGAWGASRAGEGPDLRLVQFSGPTKAEWLDDMDNAGLKVMQYIHPNTYIVWGDNASRDVFSNHPAVRWTGSFAPAYKVLPQWRNLPADKIQVDVLMTRFADTNAIEQELGIYAAKGVQARPLNDKFAVASLVVNGNQLQSLAQIPGVYSIQPRPTDGGLRGEMTNQINVNNVDGSNAAFPGYKSWLNSVSLSGAGVIIANVDGGIYDEHPDLAGRMVTFTGESAGGSGSQHGTHTAGIMAADGASGVTDSFGFLRGLGVAPGAQLGEQRYSGIFTQPGGMLKLMRESKENGASLSGNSWGPAGTPRGYDNDTMQVDIGVRDAIDSEPGNQSLTYVLSFMNGYGGTSSQGSPDEAKNIFTIGSTKGQTTSGSQILDIDDLSDNSAHGPALDGRTIPHMVAPGCRVDSSASSSGYALLCGTSMASPHVAGAVALFIEYYRNLVNDPTAEPSPALVKAAFLPAARSLAGNLDADGGVLGHPFDNKQGWGRMDLEAVLTSDPLGTRYFDNPQVFDATGQEWTVTVSALDTNQPMRMMLVWTDAPGHGLGGSTPAWNNDLDLIVESGGQTYYGNRIGNDGFSQTGGSPDNKNNTEGVYLPAGTAAATVTVRASNINSDGIPGVGSATDQDFALVIYNAAEEPGFAMSSPNASQVICAPSDAVYTINVDSVLGFTDPVTLSASGEPDGTSVSFSTNPVTPGSSTIMTISGTGSVDGGEYSILVTGDSGDISRSTSVSLDLSSGVPSMANLLSPANGATGVSLAPSFDWSDADEAMGYSFDLSTDSSFTNVIASANTEASEYALEGLALESLTTYYWRVTASNVCGDGSVSSTGSFQTRDVPSLLLVDDDDNGPDMQASYIQLLDHMGMDYDLWDTNNTDNEPDFETLAGYQVVLWFSGDEFGGAAGPGPAGEEALAAYIDAGGCVLLTSQDYLYDRLGFGGTTPTDFMSDYFGIGAPIDHDENQASVTGSSIFSALGNITLSYPFSNYSDIAGPNGLADLAFSGNVGDAGTVVLTENSLAVFLPWPLEAISDVPTRASVFEAFLAACPGDPAPCDGDVNGDNFVDLGDLNMVLANFGSATSAGDANGDGNVDLADLNMVLANFGASCN